MPATPVPAGKEETLEWGYDSRFGTVVVISRDENNNAVSTSYIKLSEILTRVPPYALRQHLKDAIEPELPAQNIDEIRRNTVLDTNMRGKVVLDVGGYMGEMARLALDKGAARAIVLDNEQWRHYGWPENRLEGVEYVQGSLTDYQLHYDGAIRSYKGQILPRPNVIILYNILYHLKNPWAYLDKCREVIAENGEMLVCTLFRYHAGRWCYWYEERECNPTDETVYNGPSLETLELWFRRTGWIYERTGVSLDRVCYRLIPIPGWVRTHEDE